MKEEKKHSDYTNGEKWKRKLSYKDELHGKRNNNLRQVNKVWQVFFCWNKHEAIQNIFLFR